MIGRTRTETGLGERTRGRFDPHAWRDRLLGGVDELLNEPLEERPRTVTLPSLRAGLRAMILLDRRLLVPLCVFAGIFFLCFLRQTDYDWWWHLRVGQDIWQSRALPAVDTYSYTRTGQPFVVHEWLFELLTYLGYRAFTYRGLIAGMAAIVMATYLLHYLLLRALGVGRVLAGALLTVTLVLSFMTITLRPHIFSTLFLSIELWCLYLYRAGHRRAVWVLPPLLLLWVNLHGAWIMGLGTLVLFIVGEWLNARARGEAAILRPALLALGASLVATLVNPTGPSLLLYPLTFIGGGSATMRYIQEWQPPNFRDTMGLTFGLCVLLLAVLGLRRPRFDYTLALWAGAFSYLGFSAVRHIPLFALVVIPIIAQQLPTRWRGPEWPARENLGTGIINWILLGVVVVTMGVVVLGNPRAQLGRTPNAEGYPTVAFEYLRTHPGGNLLNQDAFGGYLIANLPGRPVFIDTRVDFYGRDFLEQYIAVTKMQAGWRETLTRYDISLILLPPDAPLVVLLRDDPGWRVVVEATEEDDTAVLLERR